MVVLGIAAMTITVGSPTVASATGSGPSIHDLGTLGGATSRAVAINDRGEIAGSSAMADGSTHAFLWSPRSRGSNKQGMQDLGTGEAVDVNNAGQVVGNDAGRVFVWTPGTGRRDLGMLGGMTSRATDLNDRGQIVGAVEVMTGENTVSHAFRWDPRRGVRDLGIGTAMAVNASGQVAGVEGEMTGFFWDSRTGRQPITANPGGGVTGFNMYISGINDRAQVIGTAIQAFIWDRHKGARSLDTLNALSSDARDVNNRGQVVGRVQDPTADVDHAYRWTRGGGMIDLTTGKDFAFNATSTAVNDDGDVVGWTMTSAGPTDGEAFLWTQTSGLRHLGTLGGASSDAVDLNDREWIAGNSTTSTGSQHAVVWFGNRSHR
jgi:probable HAF family extracellular repeat protein